MYSVKRGNDEMLVDIIPARCPHCGDIVPVEVALECDIDHLDLTRMSTSSMVNSPYPQLSIDIALDYEAIEPEIQKLAEGVRKFKKYLKGETSLKDIETKPEVQQ